MSAQWFYVFLVRRPQDKQAWPHVYFNHELAEQCPHRASDVYMVALAEKEPVNVPVLERTVDKASSVHALTAKHRGSQA